MTSEIPVDFTPEERELTKGMPANVAVGFVAARRGTDVRDVHNRYAGVKSMLDDLINSKVTGGGQVSEGELRQAFERFSAQWPSRPKEDNG